MTTTCARLRWLLTALGSLVGAIVLNILVLLFLPHNHQNPYQSLNIHLQNLAPTPPTRGFCPARSAP